jgi:hypothetical protein
MHDPVDIRRRIDRLVARVDRCDDYGQLLASGQGRSGKRRYNRPFNDPAVVLGQAKQLSSAVAASPRKGRAI